jgi:hypothetical protein
LFEEPGGSLNITPPTDFPGQLGMAGDDWGNVALHRWIAAVWSKEQPVSLRKELLRLIEVALVDERPSLPIQGRKLVKDCLCVLTIVSLGPRCRAYRRSW